MRQWSRVKWSVEIGISTHKVKRVSLLVIVGIMNSDKGLEFLNRYLVVVSGALKCFESRFHE